MNPFSYRPPAGLTTGAGSGQAGMQGTGTKLICLVLGSTSASICLPGLLVPMALAMFALLFRLGEKPADIARGARFLIPMGILILALKLLAPGDGRIFAPEELIPALVYLGRLFVVFLLAQAFFRSTSVADLGATVTRVTRLLPLWRKGKAPDPGLYIGLAAGFLPKSFDRYDKVREAAVARGFGARRPKAGSLLCLMETVIFSSIKSAVGTAGALEARCYSPARTLPAARRGRADAGLLAAAILVFALSILL